MNDKIAEYMQYFLKQKEAGLLIFENESILREAESQLNQSGLIKASDWREVIEEFKNKQSVYLVLEESFTKEQYDLITQYAARQGAIQIMDKNSMELASVQFDPFVCHLLLIVPDATLQEIEKKYALRDKVGLIERVD